MGFDVPAIQGIRELGYCIKLRAGLGTIAECANAMYTIICTELKLCQILHMEINSQPSRVILVILNFDLSSEL
jgi:hypothetical protein